MLKRNLIILIVFFATSLFSFGQRIALKTNTLDWLVASPNLGVEFVMSSKTSLNVNLSASPFSSKFFKNKHALIGAEYRYWLSRPLSGHFFGAMAHVDEYSRYYFSNNYVGNQLAFGFTYGYNMILNDRWNLEFEVGAGYVRQREKKWNKKDIAPLINNNNKNTLAPIKLAVTFSYILK